MDALRRLTLGERVHQRDIGPIAVAQSKLTRADVHARATGISRRVVEDSALVDLSQTHANRTMVGS
jgi:hypothetical protein